MYIGVWCSPSFIDQDLFTDRLLEYSNHSNILVTIRGVESMTRAFIMTFAWSNKYTWEEISREEFETICDEYVFFVGKSDCDSYRAIQPKCPEQIIYYEGSSI